MQSETKETERVRRLKVTCLNARYAQYIKKLYPELTVVPFGTALKYRKNMDAFIAVKGKWAFVGRFLGLPVWNISEGIYKVPSHEPTSFILEKQGSYTNARAESEWEECVKATPALLQAFKKSVLLSDSEGQAELASEQKLDSAGLTLYAKRLLSVLPTAFPALSPYDFEDVQELLGQVVNQKIGTEKYVPDASPYKLFTPGGRKRIVIIEQSRKTKLELRKVFAAEETFLQMVRDAKEQHPGAAFFLLQPPSVLSGKKKGYLKKFAQENGIQIISEQVSSFSILAQADEVYTVSAKIGIDAVLLGKTVHCYGMPYYAGWGLTKDKVICVRRNIKVKREELFAALCLFFTRYLHPITKEPSHFQAIVRLILLQRPPLFENKRFIACIHFDEKQKAFFSKMYKHADIHFMKEQQGIEAASNNRGMIYTAIEPTDQLKKDCGNIPLVYVRPGSFDRLYNQQKLVSLSFEGGPYPPLEKILQIKSMTEHDLLRARLLRQFLLELSSFREHFDYEDVKEGQDVIVIIGNADLAPKKMPESVSLQHGISGNLDKKGRPYHSFALPLSDDGKLIEYIRRQRPDAYIIYCQQHRDTKVPVEILDLADELMPFARPSDFVPLEMLGFGTSSCSQDQKSEPAALSAGRAEAGMGENSEDGECFGSEILDDIDVSRWDKKHVLAKRLLEKAHAMTRAQNAFCILNTPITHVNGHALEIHTYDSHLGIDALAVPLEVYTYGWPYYGGWGLTHDTAHYSLRNRKLNFEQILAGAFITQPRYFDSENNLFCEPENAPFLFGRL